MEFPDLGAQCDVPECRQLDFLPFQCICGKKFCLEHRKFDAHNCPKAHERDAIAMVCPLCNQVVPCGPNENANYKLNEHIDRGCPTRQKIKKNRCSHRGCRTTELVRVECKSCRKNFCLPHRLEVDHDCVSLAQRAATPVDGKPRATNKSPAVAASTSRTPSPAIRTATPATPNRPAARLAPAAQRSQPQQNQSRRPDVPQRESPAALAAAARAAAAQGRGVPAAVPTATHARSARPQQPVSSVASPTPSVSTQASVQAAVIPPSGAHMQQPQHPPQRRPPPKRRSRRVGSVPPFGNTRADSLGDPRIGVDNRIYMSVYFPPETKKAPMHMFFHRNWSVAKVVDIACVEVGLSPVNPADDRSDGEERLAMYVIESGEQAASDMPVDALKLRVEAVRRHSPTDVLRSAADEYAVLLEFPSHFDPDLMHAIRKHSRRASEGSFCTVS